MPADNVEVFKKVIFKLPDLKMTLALFFGLSMIYSFVFFYVVESTLVSSINLFVVPLFLFSLFLVPGITSSELYYFLLPGYPRRWGYFLSLVNQLIIFLFTLLVALSGDFVTAWRIIWLALITLYINNFFILLLSVGPDHLRRVSLLSLVQPVMILSGFHLVLGRFLQISLLAYISNFLVILGASIVLLMAVYLTEFLVGSNVSNISILHLAAALLQNKQEKLDLGRPVKPDVQTLKISNSSGENTIVAPWVHPGPLEGFGGGRLTNYIVEELNKNREQGFFLHVPSCHQMDPSDPSDSQKVLDAISSPETTGKASKMIEEKYELGKIYGRSFGDQKIVYIDIEGYDDYESAIFEDVIDKERTTVIDLHNQPKGSRGEEMRYGTVDAEQMRSNLVNFLEKLDELEQHDYRAGFSIEMGSKPIFALVEYVDGQKTVLFGIEGNDASRELLGLEEEFQESFDKALLFTTDTHASIHDLASKKQVEEDVVREVVEEALENISDAEIGLSSQKSEEMKFLKDDYYGLIYTINILVRLIPIALLMMYIALVIWLL